MISCLCIFGLKKYRKSLADKRKSELKLQFRDMLYSISSSINAGRHLGEAIIESQNTVDLIYGKDSLISAEVRYMTRCMEEMNSSDEMVLRDFSARTHIYEIRDFVDVCVMCRKTGGNLGKMIYKTVQQLCENIDLAREKEVMLTQKRLESRILAVMPAAVTGIIRFLSSDYLDVMYETFSGRLIMTAAFLGNVLSFLWCSKLIDNKAL